MTLHRDGPPGLAERLLRSVVPAGGFGESILGDLHEEHQELRSQRTTLFATLWYWRQALGLSLRFLGRPVRSERPGEADRNKRGDSLMSDALRDLRFALRSIVHKPAFALIIVVTLALGIGANAAVFSLVDALILRPFPIPDVDRLVMLFETVPKRDQDRGGVAPANFLDWREQSDVLDEVVAFEWWDVNFTAGDQPERLQGSLVIPGFLDTLGVRPLHGRNLFVDVARPELENTAVLSFQLWARRFASDPGIVGSTVLLDGEKYEVVGIAPAGFDYPYGTAVWAPLVFDPETADRMPS